MSDATPEPPDLEFSAAAWLELQQRARRFALRLDPRYWRCPSCHQGATNIEPWQSVYWAWCELCQTRGLVGEDILDPPTACDQDGRPFPADDLRVEVAAIDRELLEQFRYEWIVALSRFHDLNTGDEMKDLFRKRAANEPIDPALLVDGWKDAPLSSDPKKVGTAPVRWREALSERNRPLVYAVLLLAAAEGATRANPYPAWYLLRSFSSAPEDYGVTGPEADKLRKNFVADPQVRAKWRDAEWEVTQAGGSLFLGDALHRLTNAGDLLQTLRRRRDELTAQISHIERQLGLEAPDCPAGARS